MYISQKKKKANYLEKNPSQITATKSENHHIKGTEINEAFINDCAGLYNLNSKFFGSFLDRHSHTLSAEKRSLEPTCNKPK